MTQVFVNRSDLNKDPVFVIASYDEGVTIDHKAHGDNVAVLHLPQNAVQYRNIDGIMRMVLAQGWKGQAENKQAAISSEANERIEEVFSDEVQESSALELVSYILQYGSDTNKWPEPAKKRKSEIDRGQSYIKAIRAKSADLLKGELPDNISADSLWPTRIKQIQAQ